MATNKKPRSVTLKVTWAQCPNRDCDSRQWEKWDIQVVGDIFCCGTCEATLERPVFLPLIKGKKSANVLCGKCQLRVSPPDEE